MHMLFTILFVVVLLKVLYDIRDRLEGSAIKKTADAEEFEDQGQRIDNLELEQQQMEMEQDRLDTHVLRLSGMHDILDLRALSDRQRIAHLERELAALKQQIQ